MIFSEWLELTAYFMSGVLVDGLVLGAACGAYFKGTAKGAFVGCLVGLLSFGVLGALAAAPSGLISQILNSIVAVVYDPSGLFWWWLLATLSGILVALPAKNEHFRRYARQYDAKTRRAVCASGPLLNFGGIVLLALAWLVGYEALSYHSANNHAAMTMQAVIAVWGIVLAFLGARLTCLICRALMAKPGNG